MNNCRTVICMCRRLLTADLLFYFSLRAIFLGANVFCSCLNKIQPPFITRNQKPLVMLLIMDFDTPTCGRLSEEN